MSAHRRTPTEPTAIELIEEAVHLLRRAPAAALAIYYLGAVPFVLGLLFFWAHTTWFQPSGETVAWGALTLVALFAIMKTAQAEFCAHLLAVRLGAPPPEWSWARLGRIALTQLRLQPWIVLVLGPATLLSAPFGWVYAYGQNVTSLGDAERLHEEAAAQAKLWPGQNHLGLLLISVLAMCAWFNLAVAFYTVPWLANRLLGIENMFGFSGWWFLNTTFLASVSALTWLAVDPLVKAFYTLRVFRGRARRTGEDVRVELQLARRLSPGRAATTAAMLLLAVLPLARLRAADAPPPPPSAVQPAQLDRAIDEVLAGSDFRWRLPPPPTAADGKDGPVTAFLRQGVDIVREVFRSIGRGWRKLTDWWDRHFSRDEPKEQARPRGDGGAGAVEFLRMLLYVFIGGVVMLILWVIWLMVKNARRNAAPVLTARAIALATPDLRDENVQAALLPTDGWMALAREQMARGEWRLAWRALYLATLAQLAAEGLLSLAKFKTNLDYERELRRRALSRVEIVARFTARRRAFEDVWYGRAQPGEAEVRAWLAELERPATP